MGRSVRRSPEDVSTQTVASKAAGVIEPTLATEIHGRPTDDPTPRRHATTLFGYRRRVVAALGSDQAIRRTQLRPLGSRCILLCATKRQPGDRRSGAHPAHWNWARSARDRCRPRRPHYDRACRDGPGVAGRRPRNDDWAPRQSPSAEPELCAWLVPQCSPQAPSRRCRCGDRASSDLTSSQSPRRLGDTSSASRSRLFPEATI